MQEGLENFQARRYHAALDCFEKAASSEPGNARIHFYLGRTLEYLKEPEEAKEAYTNAVRLNPFGNDGRKARQALLDMAGKMALKDHPPPLDPPKIVAQSVAQINNQSNDLKSRYNTYGNTWANQRLRAGDMMVSQLGYSAPRLRGRYRSSDYDAEVSNWNNIQTSFHRNDSMAQAMRYRALAARAAAETQLSATNLKRLLAERPRQGQPHLRALGTSLYVRNYSTDDDYEVAPQDPPIELRAVPGKLAFKPNTALQQKRSPQNVSVFWERTCNQIARK
jgi:tetratricopeptide (TPR) repeat protein